MCTDSCDLPAGSVSCLLWHQDSSLLLSVATGERHVQVWHNTAGLRRMIAQLEEKRPQAKGNEVYQVSQELWSAAFGLPCIAVASTLWCVSVLT